MTVAIAPTLPCPDRDHDLGGLMAVGQDRPFPLEDVRVRARIAGIACRTVVEQRFANPFDRPLEAVHIFPLPATGAIVAMELRAGDTVVTADLRERGEAERTFDQARKGGHRAALLTSERADVHTLRVTNIPARAEVTVRIEIVERLDASDGRLRWRFPTTIAPRYLPGKERGHSGAGVAPDTDRAPDASLLSPPLRLAGGTRLDLEVHLEGAVRALESSLHALRLDLGEGVRVAPAGNTTCDRDFILAFAMTEAGSRAYTNGTHTLVVVEPPIVTNASLPRDAVFVVDISGSMEGEKLDAAKKALTAALHGLMPGDRFALIAFDNHLERFADGFTAYDDRTLAGADRWIARLAARGGTEMLPALQAAFEGDTPAGRVRTVLFITDGQAHNDAELVAAVSARRKAARLFTLGIDTAVNASLLQRLARVGGGVCELATPRDDVEAVIAKVEARFGAPIAEAVTVEGGEPARPEPEALFAGRPVGILVAGSATRVKAGAHEWPVDAVATELPLGTLWARERIASLEDRAATRPWEEEAVRGEILRIALAHRLSSRFTAWVAVERSLRVDGTPIEVVQPVELPAGWARPEATMPFAGAVFAGPAMPPSPSAAMPMRARAPAPKILARAMDFLSAPAPEPVDAMPALRAPSDPAGELARSQSANGSFGDDVARTAAALVALVLLGHTRQAGTRRRTVLKAANWLATHRSDPLAACALAALEAAERGERPARDSRWDLLRRAGSEGRVLGGVA